MRTEDPVIEILNKGLTKVAEVKVLYPINEQGMVLRYSKELSDFGKCTFRVSTKDPIASTDIFEPHAYHVRIMEGTTVAWQGAIVNNPQRNKNFIEVEAYEYEYYLSKILINRDVDDGGTADNENNYKLYDSGTMSSAVTTLISSAASNFGSGHILGSLSAGTIENPDYPLGMTDENNAALTGEWSFTGWIALQFDFHSTLYVLKSFGMYGESDFTINNDLTFDFKKFLGTKRLSTVFEYGQYGNIIDYNLPRLGARMVNDYWGIASDDLGNVLRQNLSAPPEKETYGILQGVAAYPDVNSQPLLYQRIRKELAFLKSPEDSPVNVVIDSGNYLEEYGVGDIVTIKIKDHAIDFNQPRRIVGITTQVHNTGKKIITIQTNRPENKDLGE